MSLFVYFIVVLILILIFAYSNGMHDICNIIATMISSGAMTSRKALLLALVFEFLGPFIGGTMVAKAIFSLLEIEHMIALMGRQETLFIVGAGVFGATAWNFFTWHYALPSSSSHAMIGGLLGASFAAAGSGEFIAWGFRDFNPLAISGVAGVVAALLFSPFLGILFGYFTVKIFHFFLRWATPDINKFFKKAQVAASSALAFSHGTNAAQKTMGLTIMALMAIGGIREIHVPFWVIFLSAFFLSLGAATGGWRIIKTVGTGIFRVRPEHALESQIASAAIIFGNSVIGGPVSSTQVVSGSIMGVGATVRRRAVRWTKVRGILLAWVFTFPIAFIIGWLSFHISNMIVSIGS